MTGPPGHQARPSPPIGQARSPAGQAVQARSAGPARCRWRPIKGRRLGFGDPNRPLCQAAAAVRYSGRRRRHPPSSPSHRRCQATAAAPLSSMPLAPPSPSFPCSSMASSRPSHGGRPAERNRPSPASFGPEDRHCEPGHGGSAPAGHPDGASRARSCLPRGRGRGESGA